MSDDGFRVGPALSVISDGERINPFPTHIDKLIKAPCKKHPETDEKCVLCDYSKNNVYCPCGYITGNTGHIFSQKEMLFNLLNNPKNVFRKDIKMSILFHIFDPKKGRNKHSQQRRNLLLFRYYKQTPKETLSVMFR